MVRVAINGFGRIGRQVLQIGINDPDIEWVGVNDLTDTNTLAQLFKYDSVHGKSKHSIKSTSNSLIINDKEIKIFAERDPTKLPWKELDVDIVLECTGFFKTTSKAKAHLDAGAKKVFISAPGKSDDDQPLFSILKGINEHDYDKDKYNYISNLSCTTNCVAPMAKVLNDNFKIKKGNLITTHAYTGTQRLVDSPHKKDIRRGRAAAVNIIPTTTGAAKSVCKVIPELHGKLDGFAIRVPIPAGSIATLNCVTEKDTTAEEINELFKKVSKHHLQGVLQYSEEGLVSSDIINNPHSCIFDAPFTKVTDKNFVSITGWYDNEWGFSNRMIDIIKMLI